MSLSAIYVICAAVLCCVLAYRYPIRVTLVFSRQRDEGGGVGVDVKVPRERSAKEIRTFLESRSWYPEWKECLLGSDRPDEDKESFLRGEENRDSVVNAFDWFSTSQGWDCWERRHLEFMAWYLGEEKEGSHEDR